MFSRVTDALISYNTIQDDERIAVYIRGAQCINRAVDGDIVAFELLPEAEWHLQGGGSAASTTDKVSLYLQLGAKDMLLGGTPDCALCV